MLDGVGVGVGVGEKKETGCETGGETGSRGVRATRRMETAQIEIEVAIESVGTKCKCKCKYKAGWLVACSVSVPLAQQVAMSGAGLFWQ